MELIQKYEIVSKYATGSQILNWLNLVIIMKVDQKYGLSSKI